ncbi:MAG: hypothetical protein V1918_10700, partial [Planctomycetota bacterium]
MLLPIPARLSALEIRSGEGGGPEVLLDTAMKWSALVSHAPDEAALPSADWSGLGFFRLRFDLNVKTGERMNATLAYEQSARWASRDRGGASGGSGILPSQARAPFRAAPLYDEMVEEDRLVYTHEIDRAQLAWHPEWGEVVLGRQAIGFGRGVLFSASDLFAPFSPLEADREWRRGVDAARFEYRLSDKTSVEALGVLGEDWEHSALLLRARGYIGLVDGEILLGKRAEDGLFA